MTLFPELNNKECRRIATSILDNYRRLARVVGKPLVKVKSPVISDMPRTEPTGNKAEDHLINGINADIEMKKIEDAVYSLSQDSFEVLYWFFMIPEFLSNDGVSVQMMKSTSAVKDIKKRSLVEFLEAYDSGSQLVFK